jgi:hypothetical protein
MATQLEAAAHLDLFDRSIRDLVSKGVLDVGPNDLDACRVDYIRRQIAAGRSDGDDENGTLVAQRTPPGERARGAPRHRFDLRSGLGTGLRPGLTPMGDV